MSTLYAIEIGTKSVKMSKSIQPNYIENHYFHKLLMLLFYRTGATSEKIGIQQFKIGIYPDGLLLK